MTMAAGVIRPAALVTPGWPGARDPARIQPHSCLLSLSILLGENDVKTFFKAPDFLVKGGVAMVQLSSEFYARPVLEVARALLGMHLCHRWDGEVLGGRIVEVEAYLGPQDRASHARLRQGRG